ncbi:hypothetical protein LXL04_012712 [Taraxacum kok-saghyz]
MKRHNLSLVGVGSPENEMGERKVNDGGALENVSEKHASKQILDSGPSLKEFPTNLGHQKLAHQSYSGPIFRLSVIQSNTQDKPENPIFDDHHTSAIEIYQTTEIQEEEEIDSTAIVYKEFEQDWESQIDQRNRKKKRDLKMRKFHSPCNCRIKGRRGRKKCCQPCTDGGWLQPAEVVERDGGNGSDSEEHIACSNRRNMENSADERGSCSKKDELGSQIGFNLGGHQSEVMAALREAGVQRSNG